MNNICEVMCLTSIEYTFIFSPSQYFHKVFMRVELICSPPAYKHYDSYCGCQHALKAQTEETSRTQATSLNHQELPSVIELPSVAAVHCLPRIFFLHCLNTLRFDRNNLTLSTHVFK